MLKIPVIPKPRRKEFIEHAKHKTRTNKKCELDNPELENPTSVNLQNKLIQDLYLIREIATQ